MRCCFCEENVVGLDSQELIMVPGEGPAHRHCYERHALSQRRFGTLNLKVLDDELLNELKELVLTEWNARQVPVDDGIELFG